MSTIIATNFGDGTDTIPATYVTGGAAKCHSYVNQKTPEIVGSMNVSSLTDDNTGRYTLSYTAAFASAAYNATDHHMVTSSVSGAFVGASGLWDRITTEIQVITLTTSFGYVDCAISSVTIQGDLA
jgi:hypothetical protein